MACTRLVAFVEVDGVLEGLEPEELAQAREIARNALAGRVPYAVGAALASFGLVVWRG